MRLTLRVVIVAVTLLMGVGGPSSSVYANFSLPPPPPQMAHFG
jgi:hypothetical protein